MGTSKFKNEPFTDFTDKKNRKAFENALEEVRQRFNKEYPLVIGGEKLFTDDKLRSYNPSKPDEVLGTFQKATVEQALHAVETANAKFCEWKLVSPNKRAEYLFKAAKIMRKRKHLFSAMMVYEVGKNWAEADGDTAEAIDFMEFYAREMIRYSEDQPLTKLPGEKNKLVYLPLGVGLVIPPWNFPLAILAGMATASIVTGNTVVLKPSSDSPAIAQMFVELMEEVKLPKGVLNFVTGGGGTIGDVLVQHHLIRYISFTGSMEVGLRINELAAKKQQHQIWIKRVVAEMGGKDTMVIDKDLHSFDDAVLGTIQAAFGFQGQKCSACSRVVVDESIYDKFCEALVTRAGTLRVGETKDNPNMGPVINAASKNKIMDYIHTAVKEGGKIIHGGNEIEGGYFIEPTIIRDVKPFDTISQEEIFGPVLAVIKSPNFDESLKIANNTVFGLTGAAYSSSKKKLQKADEEFFVGNLYLNRKCTGALVGVHPFGGFNMSGTDSKAGGRDYLLLFMQAKLSSKKIIK
ncbi:MAG: L-glutamate gamma-semialdehyde dehydrogenase [Ignavibacteriae bacterium]|nr:L-glutamate gamma-semialdehyde dehydrogenase [Ignavibacteriota bacterium]